MSELNRVIEDRLAAVENSVADAADSAATASLAAIAAQSTADEANAKVTINTAEPSAPFQGQLWVDTTSSTIKMWNGAAWLAASMT